MEKMNSISLAGTNIWRQRPRKILLIDDEPSWQAIISHSLRRNKDHRFQLRCVRNAQQALDVLYSEHDFDLILADHYIDGEMSGLELWQACKKNNLYIPFILISGIRQEEVKEFRSQQHQFPMFIPKPFDVKNFNSVINLYLGR